MPTAEAATVERAVHVGSVVIALSCSPVSRLFHKNLQLYTLFFFVRVALKRAVLNPESNSLLIFQNLLQLCPKSKLNND